MTTSDQQGNLHGGNGRFAPKAFAEAPEGLVVGTVIPVPIGDIVVYDTNLTAADYPVTKCAACGSVPEYVIAYGEPVGSWNGACEQHVEALGRDGSRCLPLAPDDADEDDHFEDEICDGCGAFADTGFSWDNAYCNDCTPYAQATGLIG